MRVKWYLIMVFICGFLIISNVGHLSCSNGHLWIFSGTTSIQIFCNISISWFFCCCWVPNKFYILTLYPTCDEQFFPHYLLTEIIPSSGMQKLLGLAENFCAFLFCCFVFWCYSQEIIAKSNVLKIFFPCVFFLSLRMSHLAHILSSFLL